MCPSGHRRRHRSRRAPDDQGAVTIDDREFLMIPGPVSVDETVLEALARPVRAHYGDGWTELYKRCTAGMKKVFKTSGDVHLIFGSGMAGIETCIDRKSTRLNSSHTVNSYAVFCLKKNMNA